MIFNFLFLFQRRGEIIHEYVSDLCPNLVSEILERVLSYSGDNRYQLFDGVLKLQNNDLKFKMASENTILRLKMQVIAFKCKISSILILLKKKKKKKKKIMLFYRRKASPMDIWVLIHPGFKQVAIILFSRILNCFIFKHAKKIKQVPFFRLVNNNVFQRKFFHFNNVLGFL